MSEQIIKRVWKGTNKTVRKGEIVNQVYETDDYSIFFFHKENRNVITRPKMLEQAKEGIVSPIVVNGEMIVIDGQNRLYHSIKVGAPVKYLIDETLTVDDIARMNVNQDKWNTRDWIEKYANGGNEEYELLIEVLNEHYSDIGTTTSISLNNLDSSTVKEIVVDGNFKFHNYSKTIEFFHYLKRFQEAIKVKPNASITVSLFRMYRVEGFDGDRLINKILSKGFDDEMRLKKWTKTGMLEAFLDLNNDRLSINSQNYIDYYRNSKKTLIIKNELKKWAQKKTADSDQ